MWEDIKEEDVNIEELDEMFSKTALLSSKRFSPLKPKAKAKEVMFYKVIGYYSDRDNKHRNAHIHKWKTYTKNI